MSTTGNESPLDEQRRLRDVASTDASDLKERLREMVNLSMPIMLVSATTDILEWKEVGRDALAEIERLEAREGMREITLTAAKDYISMLKAKIERLEAELLARGSIDHLLEETDENRTDEP